MAASTAAAALTPRQRLLAAEARPQHAPGGGGITYWVITPEVNTGSVVTALRQSWLRNAGDDARYCVADGMSKSTDPTLHWLHGLNRSASVASGRADLNLRLHSSSKATGSASPPPPPAADDSARPVRSATANVAREAALAQKRNEAGSRELTRVYNNFLRHKVFEILREMCRASLDESKSFDFLFMMDADTAVNRSNLERFVAKIDPAQPLYTGLCKRRATWANAAQRGVGGGPGILLSRSLMRATCPKLEQCAPLRTMMDRLQFAGGDLMLAKCMEFLGHRCKMEREIPYSRGATRKAAQRLDDLFRRGPPWVYPPLIGGTILVATRRSAGARAIEQYERLTTSGLPLTSVISYHRVRPALRSFSMGKDPRCRVFAEYARLESGPAHWTSRCLPHFLLLGTPKSGTTSLFNWVLQHPDVRAPVRKELHFWAPVLTPEKGCVDRTDCAALNVASVAKAGTSSSDSSRASSDASPWPLSKVVAGRMLTNYLELFPRVDPREFAATGEASPAYLYSPSCALFLESSLMNHVRLLVLLRDPVERAFSEYKNKRDLMVKGAPKASAWVNGHAKFGAFVASLKQATDGCTPTELYVACEPCQRFTTAPGSGAEPNASTAPASPSASRCVTPPVVWQSWYHLFLPRFQRHGNRLLVEFSDDMFTDADAMMRRVGSFLGLPRHNYSTATAYNTEKRRGAYIHVDGKKAADGKNGHHQTGGGAAADVSKNGNTNQASAATAAAQRSGAAATELAVITQLVKHSVGELDAVLADERWNAPPMQHRRSVPASWRGKYSLPARKAGGEEL